MPSRTALFPLVCGLATLVIGVAGLIGWLTNNPILTQFRSDSIPIAPNTAAGFIVMGGSVLALSAAKGVWRRRIASSAAGVAVLVAALRLLEFLTGHELGVDRWLLNVPAGSFGLAPVGKMAFFTALSLLTSGVAALLLCGNRSRTKSIGGLLGLLVALAGATFALGFVVGTQLPAVGSTSVADRAPIPMAFGTALGFLIIGSGLASAVGPHAYPLRPFVGPTVRARLLRWFLPVTAAVAFAAALLANWSARAASPYHALTTSGVAVGAALAAAAVCVRIAGKVGGQLQLAEDELRRARDDLEDRVTQRTSQLSMTASDLEKAAAAATAASRELRKAQAQLVQAEKLAGLGQLVAGVAHEINNPLAFVSNNVVVLEGYVADLADMLALYRQHDADLIGQRPELAAEINEAVERFQLDYVLSNSSDVFARTKDGLKRIVQIVKDLREFARLDRSELEAADLNAGVESTINIIRGRAGKRRIALETELGKLPSVTCYPAKINQVVMNLVANAIDACNDGGHVVVRTRSVNGGVEIRVEDDGSGIDPAIRDKLFDPFFTTKPIGQGTGLGLSISYGIVQDHRGRLDLDSTPGKGTTFTVFLPTGS